MKFVSQSTYERLKEIVLRGWGADHTHYELFALLAAKEYTGEDADLFCVGYLTRWAKILKNRELEDFDSELYNLGIFIRSISQNLAKMVADNMKTVDCTTVDMDYVDIDKTPFFTVEEISEIYYDKK